MPPRKPFSPVREATKRGLAKLGLLDTLALARESLIRMRPSQRDRRTEWKRLERQARAIFPSPDHDRGKDSVLVVCRLNDPRWIAHQSLVIEAFREVGYESEVLMFGRHLEAESLFRAVGVRTLHFFHNFTGDGDPDAVEEFFSGSRELEDLLRFERWGIPVGTYTVSRLMKRHRLISVHLGDPEQTILARSVLREVLAASQGALRLAEEIHPKAVFFLGDVCYPPMGPIMDALIDRAGCQPYIDIGGHRQGTMLLRRVDPNDRMFHVKALTERTWNVMKSMEWDEQRWERLEAELVGMYLKRGTPLMDADQVAESLQLDRSKKTVAIFPHIFWDASFFFGRDLFKDYREWFVRTVEVACRDRSLNWIIKIHPDNRLKRGFSGSDPAEIVALERLLPLPDHVKVLYPDTDIPTVSLLRAIDYCVTVRGTVGIESAALGKPVVTGGTGRFSELGFTIDPDSPERYLEIISHLSEILPLTDHERELARRYAYGLYVARPLKIEALEIESGPEGKDMRVRFVPSSEQELATSPDVRAIAGWIHEGQEDLLNPLDPHHALATSR